MMIDPMKILFNSLTVWNVSGFDQVQRTLMASLISQAASGDSLRKFAAGNMSAPDSETMYALVQCTTDLDELDCTKCLSQAAGAFASRCRGKWGGRVLIPCCTLRYETYSFYNPTADTLVVPIQPPPSTPPVLSPLPARGMVSVLGALQDKIDSRLSLCLIRFLCKCVYKEMINQTLHRVQFFSLRI